MNKRSIVSFDIPIVENGREVYRKNKMIGNFFEREDNQVFFLPDIENKDSKILISNFKIRIFNECNIHSEYRTSTILRIQIFYLQNSYILDINKEDIAYIGKILTEEFVFLRISSSSSRNYSRFEEYVRIIYSMTMMTDGFVINSYNLTGWFYVNNTMQYFSNSKFNCISNRSVPNLSYGDASISVANIRRIFNTGNINVILPLFLQMHIGILAKLFEDAAVPVQYIMTLTGATGTGKTRICRELFLNFDVKDMINLASLSTQAGIERYAEHCKDLTLVLDDLCSSKDKGAIEVVERILRQFSDSTGRIKSSENSLYGYSRSSFRCGAVMTTESYNENMQLSTRLRLLVLEIKKGDINHDELNYFAENKKDAELFGRFSIIDLYLAGFINFVEANYCRIVDIIRGTQNNFYRSNFDRQNMILNILSSTLDIVIWYFSQFNIDFIYDPMLCKEIIIDLIKHNEFLCSEDEPYIIFLKIIMNGISQHELAIANNRQDFSENSGYQRYIGFYENNCLWLNPLESYDYVVLKTKNTNFISTPKDIWNTLRDKNISMCYEESNHVAKPLKKIKIKGTQREILCLKKNMINKVLSE